MSWKKVMVWLSVALLSAFATGCTTLDAMTDAAGETNSTMSGRYGSNWMSDFSGALR
jgi:hypothetical protein